MSAALEVPTFDAIYAAHLRYVLNTLRRLGIPLRDIEDVAHDVFVVVHQKLPTCDLSRPIKPWLFGIAFRVASQHRRKHMNRRESLDERDARRPDATDPWKVHGTRQLVVKALERLEWEPRAVLILADIDEATAPEIADALGMPVNRVYSRLRIARRDFKDAVDALRQEGEP
ncbi:MAG: RNA polymerase sigma factor [Sandaracinaceae bacterium]